MSTEQEPRIYRIRRYYQDREREAKTIKNNVTLTEAQAHCADPTTKGNGWFDGYDYMKGCAPK